MELRRLFCPLNPDRWWPWFPMKSAVIHRPNCKSRIRGQTSSAVAVPVAVTAPGIFTADGSGSGQGIITNDDGTANAPGNAASVGSIVVVSATGEGPDHSFRPGWKNRGTCRLQSRYSRLPPLLGVWMRGCFRLAAFQNGCRVLASGQCKSPMELPRGGLRAYRANYRGNHQPGECDTCRPVRVIGGPRGDRTPRPLQVDCERSALPGEELAAHLNNYNIAEPRASAKWS